MMTNSKKIVYPIDWGDWGSVYPFFNCKEGDIACIISLRVGSHHTN